MWVFCCFEVCFFFQKAYATHHHHHWMHSTGSWKSLMSTYPPPPLFDISRMRDVKWGCCVFNKPFGKCSCSTSHFYMIKTTRQNTISTGSCALLYGIFYVFSFEYIMTTVNKLGWKVEFLFSFFGSLIFKRRLSSSAQRLLTSTDQWWLSLYIFLFFPLLCVKMQQ